MADTRKYNNPNSGIPSNTIERQFTPEYVLKAVVEMPKRKRFFGPRASVFEMPENHGDKVTKEVRYGMLDERNVVDGSIDATSSKIGVGKIINSSNEVYEVNEYLTDNGGDWAAAVDAALTAAKHDGNTIKSYQPNGILNGKANYATFSGALAPLPEEGGVHNGMVSSSKLISSRVTFHTIHTKYTVRSNKLDSRVKLVARSIADLSDALANIKEQQIQNGLITRGKDYNFRCLDSSNAGETVLDGADVMDYEHFEAFALQLQEADVPMDTTIIKGTDTIDTVVVADSYIMYVNREVLPTLVRIKGPDGSLIWEGKEHYAANLAANGEKLLEGEIGKLNGLPFRFVAVPDLQREYGAGEEVGGSNDNGTAAQQAGAYETLDKANGKKYYDIFYGLVIGDDSFSVTGFGYNSTKAAHIPPKRDVYNDLTASVGAVTAEWSYSLLAYRPERIRVMSMTLQKSGGN